MTDKLIRLDAAIEAAVNAITCGGLGLRGFEQIAADDVRKALSALPAVGGWLDIETFAEPTSLSSGCGVLVACHDGEVGEAYYRKFDDESDGWWWQNTSWGDYPEPDRPTPVKWQPLPASPEID